MKGDFTRDTFDAGKHFTRVLQQQGRVQLDADSNEQAAILLHYLQALAADLIGPHGGPAKSDGTAGDGFRIAPLLDPDGNAIANDFAILPGHYYVDGILCENDTDTAHYAGQAGYPFGADAKLKDGAHLVYLDVWERHVTYLEMEDLEGSVVSIRESALNGLDTTTRAQVVWQINVADRVGDASIPAALPAEYGTWHDWVNANWPAAWGTPWELANRGKIKARAIQPANASQDPCITPPASRYRGAENQLYRVEIHKGGAARSDTPDQNFATFKWSRENGSVLFSIREIGDGSVKLYSLGRDARSGLRPGDWVEVLDDDYSLRNQAGSLLQVEAIDYDDYVVTFKDKPVIDIGRNPAKHPILRRWDQRETEQLKPTLSGLPVTEKTRDWIELEDGIQIQFQPGGLYYTGDYWLIPARTATGDVEWPGPKGEPVALGPRGIQHHYAPLWIISVTNGSVTVEATKDLRLAIKRLGVSIP